MAIPLSKVPAAAKIKRQTLERLKSEAKVIAEQLAVVKLLEAELITKLAEGASLSEAQEAELAALRFEANRLNEQANELRIDIEAAQVDVAEKPEAVKTQVREPMIALAIEASNAPTFALNAKGNVVVSYAFAYKKPLDEATETVEAKDSFAKMLRIIDDEDLNDLTIDRVEYTDKAREIHLTDGLVATQTNKKQGSELEIAHTVPVMHPIHKAKKDAFMSVYLPYSERADKVNDQVLFKKPDPWSLLLQSAMQKIHSHERYLGDTTSHLDLTEMLSTLYTVKMSEKAVELNKTPYMQSIQSIMRDLENLHGIKPHASLLKY